MIGTLCASLDARAKSGIYPEYAGLRRKNMNAILLIISMTACLLYSILGRVYSRKTEGKLPALFLMNAGGMLVSAIVLFFWGGIESISAFTLLTGVAFGLITMLQSLAVLKALQLGDLSLTNMFVSFSTVLSAISGLLFFGESIFPIQIIGIILILISCALAVGRDTEKKSVSLRWLLLAITAFFFTGGIGVMQKFHQHSAYKGELNAFLVIAFAVGFLVSLGMFFITRRKQGVFIAPEEKKKFIPFLLLWMALSGGCVAVNNKLNLFLSGVMDSAVFFPIVNGGGLMLACLAGFLLFKEKLSKKQWIGIAVGVVAVILLCNPFA